VAKLERLAPNAAIDRLAAAWRQRVSTATRRTLLALGFAALFAGAHLARLGSPWARAGTAAILLAVALIAIVRWLKERRDWYDLRRTVARVLLPTDRTLGEKTLRALGLVESSARDASAGSAELAALHLERLLGRASLEGVARAATRRAVRWRGLTLAFALGGAVAFVLGPMRVVEGLDVLVARNGRAPMPMAWLDFVRISAEPPGYLREPPRRLLPGVESPLPEGSLLTVRGTPLRDGRKLVLTDGRDEVPFVNDGSGAVVARWTVASTGKLQIAARFGQVLIEDPESLDVVSVPDQAPQVVVEGAPKTIELHELERLELRYAASDDHGLRQIDLVLRAGNREDRRVLSRLDGETKLETGGHALTPRDPFLRRMFLPIVITVEARDADPLRGPKWGASKPITLLPPAVGEPEARRYAALAAGRAAILDFVAWQLGDAPKSQARAAEERRRAARAADVVREALEGSYGGLTIGGGLRAFLLGQLRVLERRPRPAESSLRKSEEVALAVDVALRGLGVRDARAVSKRLAEVADEVADGAKQARETEKHQAGLNRLDAALGALAEGAEQLLVLGVLGRDLGSVAQADLGRIRRARGSDDLSHTELAARHLAARLRRPNPSFGGAGRGGVEAGAPESGAMSGEASQADDRFDQLANELAQLAQEHSEEIEKVARAISDAEQGVDLESVRDEARQRADAIRRAVSELPQTGAAPGSARASAALAKEHAGGMAQSLERLSLSDAVQSGRDAMSALRDAERKAKAPQTPSDWLDQDSLERAKKDLARELAWAEQQLERLKRAAEARARGSLGSSADREQQYAQRAGNLAGRGKSGETALPDDAVESLERADSIMREAARGLSEGKGDRSLEQMREAQRLLERATTGQSSDSGDDSDREREPRGNQGPDGKGIRTGGEVPGENDGKRAEDFRKRVLEGLGKSSGGRLAPAVKRYAEGLLR
jgi:hypothetical protein